MQLVKTNSILFGIIFTIGAFAFLTLLLSLGLTDTLNKQPWYIYVGVGALISVLIHSGYLIIKRSFQAKTANITNKTEDSFFIVGQALLVWDLLKIIFAGIIVVIISIVLLFIASKNFSEHDILLNKNLVMMSLGILVYVLIVMIFKYAIAPLWSKMMPEYQLFNDGIIINPKIIGNSSARFTIKFSEINEIKELTFFESNMFVQNLGPNIQLAWEQAKGMYQTAKTHKRPDVYIQNQSGGKTLLLRGKKILYVVTFPKKNLKDILHAYHKHKRTN